MLTRCAPFYADLPAACNNAVYVDENGEGVTDLAYLHPLVDASLVPHSSCVAEIESNFFVSDEDFKPAGKTILRRY